MNWPGLGQPDSLRNSLSLRVSPRPRARGGQPQGGALRRPSLAAPARTGRPPEQRGAGSLASHRVSYLLRFVLLNRGFMNAGEFMNAGVS
jgi:hypothetical protein